MKDDDFTPKLGRSRNRDGKRTLRYGGKVLSAARLAGGTTGVKSRRFDGSRIGRGASIGRLLSSRDRFSGMRGRRAIVKTRLVRMAGKGKGAARAHLRYIQRDGVARDGTPGTLYGRDTDDADGKGFLDRCSGDRHQFRFIVSAEDGAEYQDLKPYVRRLMTQVEQDLGTRLDWVAVDHFNTERPHSHVMLRGVDDTGANLIIAREYIVHGLRERASELATLDLGPRTDREIEDRLRHDVEQERLTAIDRRLLRRMDEERVTSPAHNDPFQQSVAAGRLRKLATMGLAEDLGGGHWRLADGMEETLRRMGERGDIIRLMQRELTARRLERPEVNRIIDPTLAAPVTGKVIQRGFSDEHRDRHYLILDGIDGRVRYIDIGRASATEPTPEGAVITIRPRDGVIREVDHTIVAVASASGGSYSVDAHLRHDPGASQAFAEAHVRRLEAMRRSGKVERLPDGRWTIAPDHLDRVAAYEARLSRDQPVTVEIVSPAAVESLTRHDGPTWLDRELGSAERSAVRDSGFGREVRAALAARQQWLIDQELGSAEAGSFRINGDALAVLRRRELLRLAEGLRSELGKAFVEAGTGQRIEGKFTRAIHSPGGRYAVIEKSREFTLVPWRPVLERQIGKSVTGIMRSDGINWELGRGRGGPTIS